jgi:hypothetical protein
MSFGCLVCKRFESCEACMCVQAVSCYVHIHMYVLIYNSRVTNVNMCIVSQKFFRVL